MSDPVTESKSANVKEAELKDAKVKADLAAAQAKADKEAATAKARAAAEKALAELETKKRELEAIAFADWGPGKPGKRKVSIPRTPDGIEAPRINGIALQGIMEVNYDTLQNILHMVSLRHSQEKTQREGYHRGVKVQNLSTGDIKFVDTYLLPNER